MSTIVITQVSTEALAAAAAKALDALQKVNAGLAIVDKARDNCMVLGSSVLFDGYTAQAAADTLTDQRTKAQGYAAVLDRAAGNLQSAAKQFGDTDHADRVNFALDANGHVQAWGLDAGGHPLPGSSEFDANG